MKNRPRQRRSAALAAMTIICAGAWHGAAVGDEQVCTPYGAGSQMSIQAAGPVIYKAFADWGKGYLERNFEREPTALTGGISTYCGTKVKMDLQMGPFTTRDELFDYSVAFYSLTGPVLPCGSQKVYSWKKTGEYSAPLYEIPNYPPDPEYNAVLTTEDEAMLPLCATRFNGPALSAQSIVAIAKKRRSLPSMIRLARPAEGVGGQYVKVTLEPAAERWRLDCRAYTDPNGDLYCSYTAPDRPTVHTYKATWAFERKEDFSSAQGTITVIPPTVVVGFFNGVWNTEEQAGDGLSEIRSLVGPKYRDTLLRYENFYNQTGTANGNTAAQDLAEVFIQRGNELDGVLTERWEHYWELLSGQVRREGSLTQRLLAGLRDGATGLSDLIDSLVSSTLAGFVKGLAQLMSSPPTAADTAAHLTKLQELADEGHDFVLIAHSQGNLFVNVAYDGLQQSRPLVKASVVHVAPASPTVRGKHVLADIDEVINGLRNFGGWTVQPINLWLNGRGSDLSGHTLVGTYLDAGRGAATAPGTGATTSPRAHTKELIIDALDQVAPASP